MTTAAAACRFRSHTVIGAVEWSGTPSSGGGGEGDAKCAEAGIERIAKDLSPAR